MNLFQKYLSYLADIPVESTHSALHETLEVHISKGRYRLCTPNAVYSWEDLYDNFQLAFEQIQWHKLNIQTVLVLGLGMGSVVQMLEKKLGPLHFTCVELDEEVIRLCNKYIAPQLKSTMEVVHGDAELFVSITEEEWDLVIVDLFVDDIIPHAFTKRHFLTHCARITHLDGLMLYNCLADNSEDIEVAKRFYAEKWKEEFPQGSYLDVHRNWILVSDQSVIQKS